MSCPMYEFTPFSSWKEVELKFHAFSRGCYKVFNYHFEFLWWLPRILYPMSFLDIQYSRVKWVVP